MKQKIILIDMDGVIVNLGQAAINHIKKHEPFPNSSLSLADMILPIDQHTSFKFSDNCDVKMVERYLHGRKEAKRHLNFYFDYALSDTVDNVFNKAEPYPGAIDGVKYLMLEAAASNILVRFCTTIFVDNPQCASAKMQWLDRYFGEGAGKLCIMTYDKAAVRGTVLIDDKPVPNKIMQPEWSHVIFDQPYNQNSPAQFRMNGWSKESVDKLVSLVKNTTSTVM